MALIVMKFGGTSVGSAERIRRSTATVAESAHHRIVVAVSALSGVTDLILKSIWATAKGKRPSRNVTSHLPGKDSSCPAASAAPVARLKILDLEGLTMPGASESIDAPSRAVVRFYNKRGTAEQWINGGKQAVNMTRLSCHRFRSNQVRLALSLLA